MRFVSYRSRGTPTWGVQTASGVVDARALGLEAAAPPWPPSSPAAPDEPAMLAATRERAAALPAEPLAPGALLPCIPTPARSSAWA
jgi:hypothetical protein